MINIMKEIKYSLTFLGVIEVPDDADVSDEIVRELIAEDCKNMECDISFANDIDWSVEKCL